MLAFILVLYCCILLKACYMSEKPIWPRDTRVKKKKEKWPKAKKKKRKKIIRPKA